MLRYVQLLVRRLYHSDNLLNSFHCIYIVYLFCMGVVLLLSFKEGDANTCNASRF